MVALEESAGYGAETDVKVVEQAVKAVRAVRAAVAATAAQRDAAKRAVVVVVAADMVGHAAAARAAAAAVAAVACESSCVRPCSTSSLGTHTHGGIPGPCLTRPGRPSR